ncbi:MAG: carbohydrate porin, partial [Bryobacterales bacterium]|nr:carbohydrate porin [Bryobacterales bacterium]
MKSTLLLFCLGALACAADFPNQIVTKGLGYFPVAIALKNGDVLAVIRGGAPHIGVKGRLDLVRSSNGGKTWSAPWTAVDGEFDDRNPAMGQLKDGTIVLAYAIASGYDETGLKFKGNRGERIFETYYSWAASKQVAVSLNWQHITNPGYNRDRGPVGIASLRLHFEY